MERRGSEAWLKFVVEINPASLMKHDLGGHRRVLACARTPRRLSTGAFVHALGRCAILISVLPIRVLCNARCGRTLHWRTAQCLASLAPSPGSAPQVLGGH